MIHKSGAYVRGGAKGACTPSLNILMAEIGEILNEKRGKIRGGNPLKKRGNGF